MKSITKSEFWHANIDIEWSGVSKLVPGLFIFGEGLEHLLQLLISMPVANSEFHLPISSISLHLAYGLRFIPALAKSFPDCLFG